MSLLAYQLPLEFQSVLVLSLQLAYQSQQESMSLLAYQLPLEFQSVLVSLLLQVYQSQQE
jgi:hypothetical protein